jgi:predicted transcriptional regulator
MPEHLPNRYAPPSLRFNVHQLRRLFFVAGYQGLEYGPQAGGLPPVLSRYVEGAFEEGESADGLLQRLQILVYPDRGEFDPTDFHPDLEARGRAYDVFKGLAELDAEGFLSYAPGEDEDLPYVNFEDAAQEIFDGWRASFEGEVVAGNYPAPLESHFMKYRSLFASLALVFEAIDFVDGVEGAGAAIREVNAMRAYAWCAYLKEHAIRIYSPMLETPIRRAEALLEHIYRGEVGDGMKTREIWRKGWRLLKSAAEVAEALEVLEEHGWARREEIKPDGRGRPSEVVRVHPELRE